MAPVWYNALRSVPAGLQPLPTAPASRVVNTQSNRCLDVDGASTAAGTRTIVYDCHGSANQSWTRTPAGELRVYGGDCLDANAASTADGTPLIVRPCKSFTNEQWKVNADGTIVGNRVRQVRDSRGRRRREQHRRAAGDVQRRRRPALDGVLTPDA
jgi:hypothetical protein